MSLAVLNEGREVPEQYRAAMARGTRTGRLLAAAGQAGGASAVGALYLALGELVHEQGRPAEDDVFAEALATAGLPASLLAAADDAALDAVVRASHDESQQRVGMDSGSPITALDDGPAYFGPVVAPVPGPRGVGPPVGRPGRGQPGPGAERAQARPGRPVTACFPWAAGRRPEPS
jgi:hypothetical protein